MARLLGDVWDPQKEGDTKPVTVSLSLTDGELKSEQFRIHASDGKKDFELIFDLSVFMAALVKTIQE